jgi:hypothetical protein
MQVAEFLSDLNSLQVCVSSSLSQRQFKALTERQQDQNAAMALVTAKPGVSTPDTEAAKPSGDADIDITRAKDLLELYTSMRSMSQAGSGVDDERRNDLDDVRKAVGSL